MSSDPETRAVYDARVRELNDIYSGQTTRYKEGLEEGIEQGRAEERAKAHAEKIEMARKLLDMGLSGEQIASATGLSVSDLEKSH